jgi:hypothetical protein
MELASKLFYLLACLVGSSFAQTYCSPGPTTTVDGNLGKVTFKGDSKDFTDSQDCPGYIGARDLTNLVADIHNGGTYELSYNVTTCGNVFPTVSGAWIDFNQNGTFDSTEVLFPFNRSNGWIVTRFTINPSTPILTGMTRMRVQVQETSSTNPLDPCSRFAYGGTKDFNISIRSGGGGGGSSSSSSGLSGGSVFIIIVIVVAAVYVAAGCAYNRFKKGTTGMRESCPQNEFWCDLPGLMKDGFLFTKAKLTGKSGGGDGYDKIDDNL